jgi:hypothetical protein
MREIAAEIDIEADIAKVWAVLTDFGSYPDWNPFIPSAAGQLEPGARLRVRIQPPGARGMTFRPTVMEVDPLHELRWLGRFVIPGLIDGEHTFSLMPVGERRVHFAQREAFRGVLVPFLGGLIAATRRGFEQMNNALKARSEQDTSS